jgi:hypothetical protein
MGRSLRAGAGVYPTAALGLRVAIPDHDSTLEVRGRYLVAGASVACRKGVGFRSSHGAYPSAWSQSTAVGAVVEVAVERTRSTLICQSRAATAWS